MPVIAEPETITLSGRPLLIVDADEVLFMFVDGFMNFLESRGLYLDLTSYRLHGNVKTRGDDSVVENHHVTRLLEDFRADLDSLEAVEDAQHVLSGLSAEMDIVVLSNVSTSQAAPRLRNLAAAGFPYPLIANSGPKGPAVKTLSTRGGHPAFFVDDIPPHLASVAEQAPDVFRIHFIGDHRLKPLLPAADQADLRADTWREIGDFVRAKLSETA
ncbi:MAG TPA: hypothetical protein VMS78_16005 [Rhizomicrobium sp.]|nr:hypothetical protein [Rhizomicrobium sp.]